MFQYAVKRLILLVITLFGITVITFVLTRLTPGDPATVQAQAGGPARTIGGYNDLLEMNRRNLGLDKPLALNLRFEDRTARAAAAVDDYLRRAEFWKNDAEKRLARVSTLALEPALDRYQQLLDNPDSATGTEERPMASLEDQKTRLAAIFPRLASADTRPSTGTVENDAIYQFWRDWHSENRDQFAEARGRAAVEAYLRADEATAEEAAREVRRIGGYAVPALIDALDSNNPQILRRANRALQAQTGFTFATTDEEFDGKSEEVIRRWNSWWRREGNNYQDPSAIASAADVFLDTQFGLWASQALFFDFGDSYIQRRPVIDMMKESLPISILLSGLSILIGYLIAIPVGIFSAIRRYSKADTVVTIILFVLYSLPSFWVAGILLMTLTGPPFLDLFPTRGLNSQGIVRGAEGVGTIEWLLDRGWHLVLPVICLTYGSIAFVSRQMRSAMLETINQDFIRTAQAKGLPGRIVIYKHALRNSLIPIVTISASLLPELIAGAIIIESIFTIPGMGTLTFQAIVDRDYPVINAVLFFSAFLTLLGILIADLAYALIDPRISYS